MLEVVGEICGEIVGPNAESIDAEGPQVVNNHVVYARGTEENIQALAQHYLMPGYARLPNLKRIIYGGD